MSTRVTRADLQALGGMTPKLLRALEDLFVDSATTTDAVDGVIGSTNALQSATVVVLSPNKAFTGAHVLQSGPGISLAVTATTVRISMSSPITVQGGFKFAVNLLGDTSVDMPTSGRIATRDFGGGPYATDGAAAAGGVHVGETYRAPSGALKWRQS